MWITHSNPNDRNEDTYMTPPLKRTATLPKPAPTHAQLFGEVADGTDGHRIIVYGPGGIGKTTLACQAPGPVAYVDADLSLSKLKKQLIAAGVPVPVPVMVKDWRSLREALAMDVWAQFKTIAIEITHVEEWAVKHTFATVKNEKGASVSRIEDYGYGKGPQHVYDTFLPLLGDLDKHVLAGRNVVLIAHECVKSVPNPSGEDWIRYEPRLQDPASGKASIRLRCKEWSDHLLFFGYDVAVDKEGKGSGSGTRTIYTAELPHFMAKSRTTAESIAVDGTGSNVWAYIIK